MTLIANSFVLSFNTLWRYLLVMPFVVIPGLIVVISVIIGPVFIFGGMFAGALYFAPLLAGSVILIFVSFLISSFMCYNIMIGCRSAFAAMGQRNDLDFPRLIGKSMNFTLVQMIAWVFIVVVLGGVGAGYALLTGGLSLGGSAPEVAMLEAASNPLFIVLSVVMVLISLAVSALLAVPMAGAAISATPKMGPTDAFIGLGSAFLPVLGVLVITQVLCTITGAYGYLGMFIWQLSTAFFQYVTEQPVAWLAQEQFLLALGMTLLVIWASSWFYAASALGWRRYVDAREEALSYKVEYDRFTPEELRLLREKRDRERGQ